MVCISSGCSRLVFDDECGSLEFCSSLRFAEDTHATCGISKKCKHILTHTYVFYLFRPCRKGGPSSQGMGLPYDTPCSNQTAKEKLQRSSVKGHSML